MLARVGKPMWKSGQGAGGAARYVARQNGRGPLHDPRDEHGRVWADEDRHHQGPSGEEGHRFV